MSSQNEVATNAPEYAASSSVWAPFASRAFVWLWLANAVSALGTWIQNAASAWIMTDLAPSPIMVSLVQATAQLPVLLLALPAGAIADLMDRKRLLIITNILMLGASAILAVVAVVGRIDPAMLLVLSVLLAIGAALNSPAWAASVPLTVSRRSLAQALVLNSVGFNIARAIGPALGGLILAASGATAAFAANAASFAFVALAVGVFLTFPRTQATNNVPPEPFGSAMRIGLAYAFAEPVVRSTLFRSAAFFGCASAIWALLPLYVGEVLGLSSASFGLMMGVIGTGVVLGGLMMPALNRFFPRNNLILLAGACCGLSLVPLALVPTATIAFIALFVFGMGWIVGASNLQATVQLAAAPWVRARALALYQAVFNGGMGLGAIFWGWLGDRVGLTETILIAGFAGGAIAILTRAIHLPPEIDDPSASAITDPPSLSIAEEIRPLLHSSRHRLRAAVSYRIDPSDVPAFRAAMTDVRLSRYRDGAVGWALSRDVSDPTGGDICHP
ncbi:MFS transporter [Bradyrhizobium sp. WYCCWR 13023]|uniref:MFS transporter n=1 Tax=Bradyrhizobium zhengyangense TaxID=2911009 RepID=A0A9X1RKP2_9BRAD|nr:MFS transporter [Bradyrhizobium zhengyangense]MCG2633198.1 MFS transporter [Bradyrhizobium zhengyangense]MCG2672312.1 MFS transporter [Bradyrhizobium zhengyangense]